MEDDGEEMRQQLVGILEGQLGYVNVRVLGKGGMGCAFRVVRGSDRSRRAVKVSLTKDLQTALEQEVMTMKNLTHPNLVPIYHNGFLGDLP